MASAEYQGCPPGVVRGSAAHPSIASALNHTVIPTALIGDQFRPLAAGDRGEPVGRRRQPVPGLAAGRDNGLVVRPDAMAQFVLSQVLPHVLKFTGKRVWG